MSALKNKLVRALRWSERYTKTDMVYLAHSGFWINLNFVFTSVFAFLLSIAFANLLTKTEYGTYQYILSISSILAAFTFTGFNTAITRSVAHGYEGTLRTSIRPQLLWNLVPAFAALTWSIYYFTLGQFTLGVGIFFVFLSLPIINAFNSYNAFLAGKQAFRESSLYGIAGNAIYYVFIFAGIVFFPSALPLIFINLSVTTIVAIIFYYKVLRAFNPNHNSDRDALPYARHLSAIGVLSTIASQIDNILVFHFLGASDLAVYSIASLLPEKIGGVFKSTISAAFPRFADRSLSDIKANLFNRLFSMAAAIFATCLLYIFIVPFFFHYVYPAYAAAIPYTQLYSLVLVNYIGGMVMSILFAHKKIKSLYLFNTIIPITQVTLQIFAIINWGLWGLVGAKVLSTFIAFLTSIILLLTAADSPKIRTV